MINTKMIVIGVLFFLVANPRTYKLVNTLLSQVGLKGMIFSGGCVSQTGVVIHAAVFTLLFCFLFSCLSIIEEGYIEGLQDLEDEEKDGTKMPGMPATTGMGQIAGDMMKIAADMGMDGGDAGMDAADMGMDGGDMGMDAADMVATDMDAVALSKSPAYFDVAAATADTPVALVPGP